jgi:hypothetical protein
MVNYQESKIYKIVGNGLTYYGSTSEKTLAHRLSKHKGNYKQYLLGKYHYITCFKVLESGQFDIVLIENVQCNSKDELHMRERYYIEKYECVNKVILGRSQKEYRETNKDHINKYNKIKNNCACSGKYINAHKSKHNNTMKHQQYMMLRSFQQFAFSIANIMNIINNITI